MADFKIENGLFYLSKIPFIKAVSKVLNNNCLEVAIIQYMLNELGYSLSIDGKFGNNTKNAVLKFQKDNKLLQDGVVGKNTWNKIFE